MKKIIFLTRSFFLHFPYFLIHRVDRYMASIRFKYRSFSQTNNITNDNGGSNRDEMLYAIFIHFSGYVKTSEACCVFCLLKKVTVQNLDYPAYSIINRAG